LAINAQHLGHLFRKIGIALFQVVSHFVRFDGFPVEDFAHRALRQIGKAGVSLRRSMLAGEKPRRPQFVGVAQVLRLLTGQRHQPGFGFARDRRFPTGTGKRAAVAASEPHKSTETRDAQTGWFSRKAKSSIPIPMPTAKVTRVRGDSLRFFTRPGDSDSRAAPLCSRGMEQSHPRCLFGDVSTPCVVALMRDAMSDAPIGVQRIGLTQDADGRVTKLGRRALGHKGVVKLWPVNGGNRLIVGEGIETVLAAATRIPFRVPLTPAWSAIDSGGVSKFPVIEGIERLVILVDHDADGMRAATTGRARWEAAGRTVDTWCLGKRHDL
jgi:hypothetical protein